MNTKETTKHNSDEPCVDELNDVSSSQNLNSQNTDFSSHEVSKHSNLQGINALKAKLKQTDNFIKEYIKFSNLIQTTEEVDGILKLAVKAFKSWGYDRVRIYLYDKDKDMLVGRKSSYLSDNVISKVELKVCEKYEKVYYCFTKKEPIVISGPATSEHTKLLKKEDVNETASLPLMTKGKVIGMVSIDNRFSKTPLVREDLLNLLPFANQVAFAIENAVLNIENNKKVRRLTTLYDVSTSLVRTFDLEEILNLVIVKIIKIIHCDLCTVTLLDRSKEYLVPKSTYGSTKEFFKYGSVPVNKSISGLAVKTVQPIYIKEVLKEPRYAMLGFARAEKIKTMLCLPLITKDEAIGTINIYTRKIRTYTKNEHDLLVMLANQAAMTIRNSEYYEKLKNERKNLSHLLEISQSINMQLKLENMFDIILEKTMELTGAYSGFLLLVKGEFLELVKSKGYPQDKAHHISIKIDQGLSGWVATHAKPLIVPDVKKDPRYIERITSTVSEATIPLKKAGKVIGVLNLESVNYDNFRQYKDALEILTNQIAVAIENVRLYNEISLFNETLKNEVFMATKELVEKNKELERMDRLKSDFVSNVSHELRTPLTSIKGYSKLLMDGKLGQMPDSQVQCMKIIIEEADRLTRLINDVLDLAKLEGGKVQFKKELMDIEDVASDVITTLSTLAEDKDITFHLQPVGAIPKISASKDLIKQVFFNLVGNAIKFTPKNGHIYIILERDNNFVRATVKDTGIGVPEEQIAKIFDKFYQVDTSMTRQHGGTGLGLPIAKHIVDAHKGRIYAESEVGKGSSFIFELPIKKLVS